MNYKKGGKKEAKKELNSEEKSDEEKILEENIKEFQGSADLVYKKNDFTSATILYFKTLFGVLDLIILKNTGKIPKDHSERFRMLESSFSNLYKTLDELYSIYRNTYTAKINKENCDRIKENVQRIIKEQKIFENN